ncbi:hypothetical protein [Spiroplasma endosymbiont of Othius punctulatus]|uniref:hypothetical protein n=1 Tax=Spiroplasma endosymbiont of Othius punctulatus TaxID=3066289 RepID=UPI0030CDB99F
MVDKFGKIMVYAKDPSGVANFFINKINFVEIKTTENESKVISVTVAHNKSSDTFIEFFDINIVKQMNPELNTGTPSICFSSFDVKAMRDELIKNKVNVGELVDMGGTLVFNFSDIEDNYFAVQEISK